MNQNNNLGFRGRWNHSNRGGNGRWNHSNRGGNGRINSNSTERCSRYNNFQNNSSNNVSTSETLEVNDDWSNITSQPMYETDQNNFPKNDHQQYARNRGHPAYRRGYKRKPFRQKSLPDDRCSSDSGVSGNNFFSFKGSKNSNSSMCGSRDELDLEDDSDCESVCSSRSSQSRRSSNMSDTFDREQNYNRNRVLRNDVACGNKVSEMKNLLTGYRNIMQSITPKEIIGDYRKQVNMKAESCSHKCESALEKVSEHIRNNEGKIKLVWEAHLDIIKRQQETFDKFMSKVKSDFGDMYKLDIDSIAAKCEEISETVNKECMLFKLSLPAYAFKQQIMNSVEKHQVTILLVDACYSASIAIPLFLEHMSSEGMIVSCEPTDAMAIGFAQSLKKRLVSSKINVAQDIVAYETSRANTRMAHTKILFTTIYDLFEMSLKDPDFTQFSCVIFHYDLRRNVKTDFLLESFRSCLSRRKSLKIVIIVQPGIETDSLRSYFSKTVTVDLVTTPNLILPVHTFWKKSSYSLDSDYLKETADTVTAIHTLNSSGDVLVFLPDERDIKVLSLHLSKVFKDHDLCDASCIELYKNKVDESLLVPMLNAVSQKQAIQKRRIILATGWAELMPFPTVSFVVDTGLVKDSCYDPGKSVEVFKSRLISSSRAKIRKLCAGRYHEGSCYRLYNKKNYAKNMIARELPHLLVKSPYNIMMQMFRYRPECPMEAEFIESLSCDVRDKALEMLKSSGAVKDSKLSAMGKQMVKLPYVPTYSKIIVMGTQWGFGFDAIVIVAFFMVNKPIFIASSDKDQERRIEAMKIQLLARDSDTFTFLNIYQLWMENKYCKPWCLNHCIDFPTMKEVKKKVDEILRDVHDHLEEEVHPETSYKSESERLVLQELLFECFRDNLCVFNGHYRTGYQFLKNSCMTFFHPSSPVIQRGEMPKFVVFDSLHTSSRNYMMGVTAIPESVIEKAKETGSIDKELFDVLQPKLCPSVIEPVSVMLIKHILLNENMEENIRKAIKCDFVVVEPSVEEGNITFFTLPEMTDKVRTYIQNVLENMKKRLLLEEENQPLELRKGDSLVSFEITWKKGGSVTCVKLTSGTKMKTAATDGEGGPIEGCAKSAVQCSVKITWPRRRSKGYGFVSFKPDDFIRGRRLAMTSLYVMGSQAEVQLNKNEDNQLFVSSLGSYITEENLKEAIEKRLGNIVPEDVRIIYEKPFVTTDEELVDYKNQLALQCCKYVDVTNFSISVPCPDKSDKVMTAFINVTNSRDAEYLSQKLNGFHVGEIPVYKPLPMYKSVILCSIDVFQALGQRFPKDLMKLEQDIGRNAEFLEYTGEYFHFNARAMEGVDNMTSLELLTNNSDIMNLLQGTVHKLLEGEIISCRMIDGLHKLFTHGGHLWLRALEKKEFVHIIDEYKSKTLRIYGAPQACNRAHNRIRNFIQDIENEIVKVTKLGGRRNARGLLKSIIKKYGINLSTLIEKYQLRNAEMNIRSSELTLHGSSESIDRALQALDRLYSECSSEAVENLSSSEECCSTCGVPPSQLSLRLEHCGHLYCAECLNMLVLNTQFPIKCCAEDCDKDLILEDIRKALENDDKEINKILEKSVTDFIVRNKDHMMYCPAPDCPMFFDIRTVVEDKWHCPLCLNDICIRCNVVFHHGLSCDMFQGSKNDPDYSYRVWLRDTKANSSQCPKCKTAIEKTIGCNHMTCLNCRTHFCWLCNRAFPTGDDVYRHQSHCPGRRN